MEFKEYQEQAMRTNSEPDLETHINLAKYAKVLNAILGLNGESGELTDMWKKFFFQGHELDEDKEKKELGDIFWYIALYCEERGFGANEIMQKNIDKLKGRYPEGFDPERSVNRNE